MKHIRCPKCHERLPFDAAAYAAGTILVFRCPACNKEFKVRIPPRPSVEPAAPNELNHTPIRKNETASEPSPVAAAADAEDVVAGFSISVVENEFQQRQVLTFHPGRNVIGRYVRGTKADAPILTVDPSIDTTHCVVSVRRTPRGLTVTLSDAPSGTGTFVGGELLSDRERRPLSDGDVVTLGAATLIVSLK